MSNRATHCYFTTDENIVLKDNQINTIETHIVKAS